jgi:putative transposase
MEGKDKNFSIRWSMLKTKFTRLMQDQFSINKIYNESHLKRQEATFWQRRFWEHTIRDDEDYANHFNYIHYNPVKHGYVASPKNWEYSTFHRYVKVGFYPINWASHEKWHFEGVNGGE